VFEKAEGVVPYCVAGVGAEFRVVGDFEISVTATRTALGANGDMGLGADYNDSGDQAAIWFVGGDRIYSSIIGLGGTTYSSASAVTFRLRRVGTTVYAEYNVNGWLTAASRTDPSLAGPVRPNVFFFQDYGESSYMRGNIDDLVITADAFEGATAVGEDVPSPYWLGAAIPNPFSETTSIAVGVPPVSSPHISVFDVTGRLVTSLAVDGSGYERKAVWNGRDKSGHKVPGGIYFAAIKTPSGVVSRKLVLIR
jgi:hypothetical protein